MSVEQVTPWYSGATTFLKSPQASFDDIKPGMVAIGGAPHDSTHGHRAGARYGPRGIREGSQVLADKLRPAGEDGLIHVGSGSRLSLPTENKLVDVGDYNSYPTDMDRAVEGMAGGVYEVVKRGGFSVCLGGDHFVGYPSCLGFTRAAAELNPNVRVGYIHIDGHLDFTDITPLFGRYSNGTNARRISEIEVVSPSNMVWVGIDGYVNAEQADTIKRNGATVFTGLDVQEMGPVEVARRAGELAIDGCDYIYLSMDIDVVDSGFSPGTGSPVFAAITPMTAMRMLWELSKFPIGSMDFCETSPRLDPTGRSNMLAPQFILGIIGPKVFDVDNE